MGLDVLMPPGQVNVNMVCAEGPKCFHMFIDTADPQLPSPVTTLTFAKVCAGDLPDPSLATGRRPVHELNRYAERQHVWRASTES
ncbi:MAG: hypothetical protein M1826_001359 [Phylliscum demangeonii]|nr:MAG: hypothetical protein M1826_001359 [Phylliscum demangeonii]